MSLKALEATQKTGSDKMPHLQSSHAVKAAVLADKASEDGTKEAHEAAALAHDVAKNYHDIRINHGAQTASSMLKHKEARKLHSLAATAHRKAAEELSNNSFTINPAVSEAQRRFLNATKGHDWVKEHHFDNEGKLPETVDEDEEEEEIMNRRQKQLIQNTNSERHHHDGTFAHHAKTVAGKAFEDLAKDGDDGAAASLMGHPNKKSDDGRDTVKIKRVPTDLDGDGDGPVDDYWWRNIDESGEQTDTGDEHVGGRLIDKGVMNSWSDESRAAAEATRKAHAATAAAPEGENRRIVPTGTQSGEDSHLEAADAHFDAADAHDKAASAVVDPTEKAKHEAAAKEHWDAGTSHVERGNASSGKKVRGTVDATHDAPTKNANPKGVNQYTHGQAAELHEAAAKAHDSAANHGGQLTNDASKATDKARRATDKLAGAESELGGKVQKTSYSSYQAAQSKKSSDNAHGPSAAQSAERSRVRSHEEAAMGHRELAEAHRKATATENSMTANVDKCQECGGEMDEDGECEECGWTENAFGDPDAPVSTQPDAHSATVAATTASMDHPPARGHAVAAFDHSKGGKTKFAAARHGKAASAHDEAMQDSINGGDQSAADAHGNAAMLHRKAAAMHGMTTNDFGPAAAKAGHPGQVREYAAIIGKSEGSYPETKHEKASLSASKASKHANKIKSKSAHQKAGKAHREAAEAHKETGMEQGPGGKIAHHEKMAKSHFAKAGKSTRNELFHLDHLIANCTCEDTRNGLIQLRNAKAPGSNADETGSSDFDDAEIAGGWDDSPDDDEANYKNDQLDGSEDTEDETEAEPLKTGGKDATAETRGRVGNMRLTANQADQFSRAIFGKPLGQVREEARMVANVMREQKTKIIRKLVGHLSEEHAKTMARNHKLYQRSIEELRDMLAFQRPEQTQNHMIEERSEVYLGASLLPQLNGEQTVNSNDQDDINAMVPPVVNFAQWQAEDRAARNSGGNYATAVGRAVQHTSAESAM